MLMGFSSKYGLLSFFYIRWFISKNFFSMSFNSKKLKYENLKIIL